MSFIDNAKKLKKEKGYTTNDLSKMCGIPLGTLSKLFSGIIEEPKLSAAVAISKALDTTVDSLCEINEGTYTSEERELIIKYRKLDEHGKNLAELIIKNELTRLEESARSTSAEEDKQQSATTADQKQEEIVNSAPTTEFSIRTLPLYPTAFAAIDENASSGAETANIRVKNTGKVTEASFALRVSDDSMMPEYAEGDILIIKKQDSVSEGEFGIFIIDNNAYFRKFSSDKLCSLSNEYPDIRISDFNCCKCVGLVLGRLKSKKN